MNNDEIIAKANEFYEKLNGQRQEDEEGLLVKSHILTLTSSRVFMTISSMTF